MLELFLHERTQLLRMACAGYYLIQHCISLDVEQQRAHTSFQRVSFTYILIKKNVDLREKL